MVEGHTCLLVHPLVSIGTVIVLKRRVFFLSVYASDVMLDVTWSYKTSQPFVIKNNFSIIIFKA